jgi:hypothetical protein
MGYTQSPNMLLPIPGVGTEASPTYAFDVNSSLTLIDQHDHSLGKGVQITPAGININANLPFNGNSALSLLNAVFNAQSVATSTLQALSVAPGSESPVIQDLWYTDSMGNKVQITSGGELAPVTASIEGITYAGGTFSFTEAQSGLPTTPANISAGSITLRPNVAATTFGAEIIPPSSTFYDLTLPPVLPGAQSFVTLDNTGALLAPYPVAGGLTRSMLATGAVAAVNTDFQSGSTYAVPATDDYLEVSASAATTITLFAVSGNTGRRLTIKKVDSTLLVVTITGPGGFSTTLNTMNESVDLIINNSGAWTIVNRTIPEVIALYTPAFTNITVTSSNLYSFRRGSYLVIKGNVVTNGTTVGAPTVTIGFNGVNIPIGLSINTVQLGSNNMSVGSYASNANGASGNMVYQSGNATVLGFGFNFATASSQIAVANNGASITPSPGAGVLSFNLEVPIAGWNG